MTKYSQLSFDGVAPTADNVTTNKWPLWSYEHMYTQNTHPNQLQVSIKYMQSEKVQKTLVTEAHYISIHDMKVEKTPTGKVTERK